jgi:hypothetical protein
LSAFFVRSRSFFEFVIGHLSFVIRAKRVGHSHVMAMATLRHIANLWSLREYPTAEHPWSTDEQLDAIKTAGFDGVTGRITLEVGAAARKRGLMIVGYISSSDAREFKSLLEIQKSAGARLVNVQLGDHDTLTDVALRLTLQLFETAEEIGDLELSVEVHRDTCTETPEKTYALADTYYKVTGRLLPITWDFSHFAVVKHLAANVFSERLLVRPDLVQRSCQFHFRPFNGHHCQVPVTRPNGSLSREFQEWLPFVKDTIRLWLAGNQPSSRELFLVPEMGPVSSGYNLEQLPNSWDDAARLRPVLETVWQDC